MKVNLRHRFSYKGSSRTRGPPTTEEGGYRVIVLSQLKCLGRPLVVPLRMGIRCDFWKQSLCDNVRPSSQWPSEFETDQADSTPGKYVEYCGFVTLRSSLYLTDRNG
jgi:hypothetical protein